MKRSLLASLFAVSALMTGCAHTTHTVSIAPTASEVHQQYHNTHRIRVVVPPFDQQTIGMIDTGIGEHATIMIGNDASSALLDHVTKQLSALGITPEQGYSPTRTLSINIETLSYDTTTIGLKTQATLVSEIKATVTQEGKTYTANFKSEKIDQYGTLPDREVVENEINALLGKTVDRAFSDPQLMSLLTH